MRFELTIPPNNAHGESAILAVEAPNWLNALQEALSRVGEEQIPRGKAVCEIKDDGSIVVRNAVDGRQFHIRPTETTAEVPAVAPQPKPRRHTPFGTMTYLEAELGAHSAALAPAHPLVEASIPPQRNAHPCMVFDRLEIERRVKAEKSALDKARKRRDSSPAMVAVDNARDVRFIQVVDVEPKQADTLTSLRVDLDELRQATEKPNGEKNRGPRPPKGYEWLQEALEAALRTCRSAEDVAQRTLPLLVAALPSRTAIALIQDGTKRLRPLFTLGHLVGDECSVTPREIKGSPLELPLVCGMSLVLDNSPGAVMPAIDLAPWLGYSPESGLLAAITNGPRTLGVLLLSDALGSKRFTASHLALANYVGATLFPQLEYWLGSTTT
jgi:hypothetical protein